MTYQELKERVYQQGNQCGVNLMSSAVLDVKIPATDNPEYDALPNNVATQLAFAFGFSKDDVDEDGFIYKDTCCQLCALLVDLRSKSEMPIIRVSYDIVMPELGRLSFSQMLLSVAYEEDYSSETVGGQLVFSPDIASPSDIRPVQSEDFQERPTE